MAHLASDDAVACVTWRAAVRGTEHRMNERLTEQDLGWITSRLAALRARVDAVKNDGRFMDDAVMYLQEALNYAEQLLQDVRAARQATPSRELNAAENTA
jgi:hypothetical protein